MFLQSTANRDLVDHFVALANPTRLRMLEHLSAKGEMSVNELATKLHMSQPRISWHLRILRTGGVIRTRRDGRLRYCSLDMDSISARHGELNRLLIAAAPPAAATQQFQSEADEPALIEVRQ
ncbi:MAG TPA: metalloregulator ArsR/SmtB family transcription factor [Candidatus Dormibacteraeota bacterium]|jgi:DNA-binding transcriptional ArsR family regulator|nr:metalloregulator ArsR/SmtB family transcription factor [Candidatus Dormibacteraeota bacterium]